MEHGSPPPLATAAARPWLPAAYAAAVAANVLLFSAACVWLPRARPSLTREDHLLENVTAGVYLAGFLVGCVMLGLSVRRGRPAAADGAPRRRRWPAMLLGAAVPALALLAFLDEVSFGVYHADVDVPEINDVKIDAAHDGVDVVFRALSGYVGPRVVTVAAFLVAFLVMAAATRLRRLTALLARAPWAQFVVAAALLAGTAAVLDLRIPQPQPLAFAEELLEVNAALSLLFACLAVGVSAGPARRPDVQ
jgi:hypothetical protein